MTSYASTYMLKVSNIYMLKVSKGPKPVGAEKC